MQLTQLTFISSLVLAACGQGTGGSVCGAHHSYCCNYVASVGFIDDLVTGIIEGAGVDVDSLTGNVGVGCKFVA